MIIQKTTIGLKDVYGRNVPILDIVSILKKYPKSYIKGLVNFLNKDTIAISNENGTMEFLQDKWFSKPCDLLNKIHKAIYGYRESLTTKRYIIFNLPTTLRFIELFLEHSSTEVVGVDNIEAETELLNIYLRINDEQNAINLESKRYLNEAHPTESLELLLIIKHIQYADILNYHPFELLFPEIIKTLSLFELLKQTNEGKELIQHFLSKYATINHKEYVYAIFIIVTISIMEDNLLISLVEETPFKHVIKRLLDITALKTDDFQYSYLPDYIALRENPIFKDSEDRFQIINLKFLIEKIHKSLYFSLNKINNDRKLFKKFLDNFYCKTFAEETVFYDTLNRVFKTYSQKLTGKEMEVIAPGFGASDFIVNFQRNTFLFESKSVFIKKESKVSLDAKVIRKVLQDKFFIDAGQDKAIKQLCRNVINFYNGEYKRFGVENKTRFIYPVIVVHSQNFNVFGLEELLNKWFREEMIYSTNNKRIYFKTKPVVLIDINTLLFFEDIINKSPKLSLNRIIDEYLINKRRYFRNQEEAMSTKFLPFAFFLRNYIRSNKKRVLSERVQFVINDARKMAGLDSQKLVDNIGVTNIDV